MSLLTLAFRAGKSGRQTLVAAASANAALPKLTDAGTQLDAVKGLADKLPADGKKALASAVAAGIAALKPMIDPLLANTALAPIVKPAIDALMAKLDAIAKA